MLAKLIKHAERNIFVSMQNTLCAFINWAYFTLNFPKRKKDSFNKNLKISDEE